MSKTSVELISELQKLQVPRLEEKELKDFVQSFIEHRNLYLATMKIESSPLYLIDTESLIKNAQQFRQAFTNVLPDIRIYYALKSNNHPTILNSLVQANFGLDVSSGKELQTALDCKATNIVFSGPGKQTEELKLAVKNSDKVTVLIDSFRELEKLEEIASQSQTAIRAGVRITTDDSGIWRKFGIPLSKLHDFFDKADVCKWVNLSGLQFHLSWNLNPASQVVFIARLGNELRKFNREYLKSIKFIDIGGGFWPEQGEWLQPAATPHGMFDAAFEITSNGGLKHYKRSSSAIYDFAKHLSSALHKQLPDEVQCSFCLEPGRWICHEAMHILLTVVDVKHHDVVITDGGTNAIGWDRFETDYFPVINLTRPSLNEHECLIAGSLCTPHDIWGYSYFGNGIAEGDILLIPNQGAYTYSLKQEFIKPLPKSIILHENK